jgi:hypothetical protein
VFHEEVVRLPAKEWVAVDLIFYHGWTQAAVVEVLDVSVCTVQRRCEPDSAPVFAATTNPCRRS